MTEPVVEVATISRLLRENAPVADSDFDLLLSNHPRKKSGSYWSCVKAAQTASRLFREAGATRILDVGSGVGKFCSIASLTLGRRVWGVERRGELVDESRRLARRLNAEVEILEGTLGVVTPARFDGFYFYNPFGEYVASESGRYDGAFPRSFDDYLRDVRLVERWLRAAPVGTALVTYNGLGGRIPASFGVRYLTLVRDDIMRLWVKERDHDDAEAFIEVNDLLVAATSLQSLAKQSDSPLIEALCRAEEPGDCAVKG